jgi:hypothetical protein
MGLMTDDHARRTCPDALHRGCWKMSRETEMGGPVKNGMSASRF